MPPGREVDMPNGEGNGSSPSWEELSRNPFAKGFDSIFSLVIWKTKNSILVEYLYGQTSVNFVNNCINSRDSPIGFGTP